MSENITLLPQHAFPVTFGDHTFLASSWHLTAQRRYTQIGGATGDCFVSNSSLRAKELTLSGSFYFDQTPAQIVTLLEQSVTDQTRFSFTLRGIRFVGARLIQYELDEESKNDLLQCSLTLILTNTLTAED